MLACAEIRSGALPRRGHIQHVELRAQLVSDEALDLAVEMRPVRKIWVAMVESTLAELIPVILSATGRIQ
jgi:phage gp46-like protein